MLLSFQREDLEKQRIGAEFLGMLQMVNEVVYSFLLLRHVFQFGVKNSV